MDKLQKYLIENLCSHYNCSLSELVNGEMGLQFWAATFVVDNEKHYIIFSDEKNFDYIDATLEYADNIQGVSDGGIIKVLLIEKVNDITRHVENHGKGNLVIVDKSNKKVVFCSEAAGGVGNAIEKLMSYFKEEHSGSNYIVTWSIIIVNIAMYIIASLLSGSFFDIDVNVLNMLGAKNNELISNGEYYRLISCMFLHGNLIHIASNMYSLYSVGYIVEKVYGKTRYILIYFISGIISSIFSFAFSSGISVGASGAIFGVLGAVLVFAFKLRQKMGKELLINILSVIALNIFIGLSLTNIDNFAHAGGLIGGIIVSIIVGGKVWEK